MVDEEEIATFERDGVVCLRQRFESHWLETLAAGFEKNLAAPGPNASQFTPEGNPGGYFDDFLVWDRIQEYRDFIFDSPAAEIAGRLTRSGESRHFLENALIKEPGTREVAPWHQDLSYYCVTGTQLCSVWVPLDPVPRPVCVESVAGSHRLGKLFTPVRFTDLSEYEYPPGVFEPMPDIESHRDDYQILSWDLEPGDCVVFHMATLHSAPGTAEFTSRRRAFSTRWLGDDAVYADRPGKMYPEVEGLVLRPGEPVHDDAFPLVWQATT
jgi:ectoine hydroxylase-related dioxygenase (phytanoyl-CoA dioxygenase family)